MNLDMLFQKKNTFIFSRFNRLCWAEVNKKVYFLERKIKRVTWTCLLTLEAVHLVRHCHIYFNAIWERIRYCTNKPRKLLFSTSLGYMTWACSLSSIY